MEGTKRLPEHPLWLEYDAFLEPDGLESKAFAKLLRASRAWAKCTTAWSDAFVAEYLAHHRAGENLTPPCAATRRKIPKYRKSRK